MNTILVSFIIPCFNSSLTIERTIKSIFNQTNSAYEIIVVDDGSNDNTADVVFSLFSNRNNCKLYTTNNNGALEARNFGFKKASGVYIYFLDSDDIISDNFVETIFEIQAKKRSADVLLVDSIINSTNKRIVGNNIQNGFIEPKNYFYHIAITSVLGFSCLKVYKKSFLKKFNIHTGKKYQYSEDLFFSLLTFDKEMVVYNIGKVLHTYMDVYKPLSLQKLFDIFDVALERHCFVCSLYPDLESELIKTLQLYLATISFKLFLKKENKVKILSKMQECEFFRNSSLSGFPKNVNLKKKLIYYFILRKYKKYIKENKE